MKGDNLSRERPPHFHTKNSDPVCKQLETLFLFRRIRPFVWSLLVARVATSLGGKSCTADLLELGKEGRGDLK